MTPHQNQKLPLSHLITHDLSGLSPIQTIMKMAEPRNIQKLGLNPHTIISFGGGWCNHLTPPALQNAYHTIITDQSLFHKSGRYSAIQGNHHCRTMLAEFEKTIYHLPNITADNIILGHSSTQLFHDLLRTLINPTIPICLLDPTYANYYNAIKCALPHTPIHHIPALNPTTWEYLPDETTALETLTTHCQQGAKLLILPIPDNPTSQIPSDTFIQHCYEILEAHHGYLILDMAYKALYFNKPPKCFSWSPNTKPHLITIHSNSKWLSSLGRRFGWIEAAPPIIKALEKITESTLLSPDTLHSMTTAHFLQETLPKNTLNNYLTQLRTLYKDTAQVLTKNITNNLDWKYLEPQGGLYTVCPVPSQSNATKFSEKLLQNTGVLVIPGHGFGPSMKHGIRLSYGPLCYDHDRIKEGIERIATYINKN